MSDITVMTHFVKKQKCREFEDWLHGIVAAAAEFKGYQGINILKPMDDRNEYTTTVRFNEKDDREAWESSAQRAEWVARLPPLIETSPVINRQEGFEFWFQSGGKVGPPPPKWKMAILAFSCSFPLILLLTRVFLAFAPHLPLILRTLMTSGCMIYGMTWFLLPWLTKTFSSWLHQK